MFLIIRVRHQVAIGGGNRGMVALAWALVFAALAVAAASGPLRTTLVLQPGTWLANVTLTNAGGV
jgi:hypothetical protein